MECHSLASLQTCCDCGMKVVDGREEKGELKQTEGHYTIRQPNHCEPSLKELCHCTSVNFWALMTNDSPLVSWLTLTLLRNELKREAEDKSENLYFKTWKR